jgi:hypothetical protein
MCEQECGRARNSDSEVRAHTHTHTRACAHAHTHTRGFETSVLKMRLRKNDWALTSKSER